MPDLGTLPREVAENRDPGVELSMMTLAEFQARSLMPSEDVDALEVARPGFIERRIAIHAGRIHGRLAKRYAVPFVAPVPEVVLGWLEAFVTFDAYQARGFNPRSEQDMLIAEAAKNAGAEIREAADSKDGLFDLPLREDTTGTSGVSVGGPLGYSEISPWRWTTVQRDAVDAEGE